MIAKAVEVLGDSVVPGMLLVFALAIIFRLVIFYIVNSESLFVQVLKANVKRYMNGDFSDTQSLRFHKLAEYLFYRSFFEYFELRRKFKRRRGDRAMNFLDRLFLFEIGTEMLIEDALTQTQYHHAGNAPDFDHVSKFVYNTNPYYNKLFGLAPMRLIDSLINILPGLFIIGGIMGTFVGIMQGIPELKLVDVTDTEATQKALEGFLDGMVYAMGSSVMGIGLSVLMNVINTSTASYSKYVTLVDEFKDSLRFIWNESIINETLNGSDVEKNRGEFKIAYFEAAFNKKGKDFYVAGSKRRAG